MDPQTLTTTWHVRPVEQFSHGFYERDDAGWLPTTVPGHWQQHPELEFYGGKVVYRCLFSYEEPSSENRESFDHVRGVDSQLSALRSRTWLRVNGAFYWSQPYLNGVDLGHHEGYFAPYEREVTELLEAQNTLLIELDCPDEHNKAGKRLITGVFSHWDGSDPATNPGGIWLPVELHHSGPVRIKQVRCHTETFSNDFAQLRYRVDLDATGAAQATLRWTISPKNFAGVVQVLEQRRMLRAGPQELSGFLKLRDPHLWWTHDLGDPNLYTITLDVELDSLLSDRHSFAFGIRRFELRNWIAYLNGVRFLIKGNNYAPGDTRIATMTRERYDRDIQLARECHMNLLRVHAHVEHPTFYEAANAQGLLIWQDMPLQWLYKPPVLPEAQRQVREMVRLLYNHPAVAIWCMHNEAVYAIDTADERLRTRLRTYNSALVFNWTRDVLDTRIQQIAQQEDHQRPVIRSSGEPYIPRVREGTDAHMYFGWYAAYGTLADAEYLSKHLRTNMRFVTEFGAQSFPEVESCVKFMDADIRKIDFDHLRERHQFQPEVMARWIDWRSARSLEELVALTQNYQIFINRYYVDRLRVAKYRPTGGIVPFMFHDPNPAVQWSIIDYWRVPKRSYYALQTAFSPQYACAIFPPRTYRVAEPVTFTLHAVNDAQHTVQDVKLEAWLRDPEGRELAHVAHTLTLQSDCLAFEVDRLRLTPSRPGRYSLALSLRGEGCSTVEQEYGVDVVG